MLYHAVIKNFITSEGFDQRSTNFTMESLTPFHAHRTVIRNNGFEYLFVGFHHDYAKLVGLLNGDVISDGMGAVEYMSSDKNYMRVKAIYNHNGKYYYIPGTFSMMGTLDPNSKCQIVISNLDYVVETLDSKVCQKVCPGYL